MESITFLRDKLNELYNLHPYLEIRYEHISYLPLHIVDVRPVHCFKGDKPYIDNEIQLEDLFEQMFPNEEILFVSEESLMQVENPILTLGVSGMPVTQTCISKGEEIYEFIEVLEQENSYPYEVCILEASSISFQGSVARIQIQEKPKAFPKLVEKIKNITKNKKKTLNQNQSLFFY